MLNGIIHGYAEIVVFNLKMLNYPELANYIVERSDSIVNGLTQPLLKREQLLSTGGVVFSIKLEELVKDIDMIKEKIEDKDDGIYISLDVIGAELNSNIRKPVIFGMISNLRESDLTEELVKKITQFLNQ